MRQDRGNVNRARSTQPAAAAGPPEETSRFPELDRLVFFTDAVFAIAMTLLVVRIDVPHGPDYAQQVWAQWPKYLSFFISFSAVGLYWMGHHRIFRFIKRWDDGLLWLNLLLLLPIAFMPFPAAMIGEQGGHRISLIFYAATLGSAGLINLLIWLYATRDRRLVDADLDAGLIRRHRLRGLVAPLVFFLSIPLSFVSMDAAYYSWLLIIVAQLALRRFEGRSAKSRSAADTARRRP